MARVGAAVVPAGGGASWEGHAASCRGRSPAACSAAAAARPFWLLEVDDGNNLLGQISGGAEVGAKMRTSRSWTASGTRGRATCGMSDSRRAIQRERRGRRRKSGGGGNLGAWRSWDETATREERACLFQRRCSVDLSQGGAIRVTEMASHAVTKDQIYQPELMIQTACCEDPTVHKRRGGRGLSSRVFSRA